MYVILTFKKPKILEEILGLFSTRSLADDYIKLNKLEDSISIRVNEVWKEPIKQK